jgi:hypothetical protein
MATHHQTHNGGRHLVVGEALLRGYSANLRGSSTYVEINGHVAQVQVAAKGAWMIENVDKYVAGTVETVVLVDVTGGVREFYIVAGDQLRRDVAKRHAAFLQRVGGTRPRNPSSKHTGIAPEQVRRWRNRWSRFD